MKKKIKNLVTKVRTMMLAICMQVFIPLQVYAGETGAVAEPAIVSGTKLLLAALIGIITAFIVSLITFSALKVGAKWTTASAEEKPKYQKELISTIIAGVVTLTIGGTITWIVGFYQ